MKKELVIIALTVTMMGINNMYGKAFADPAHCDQPGWPSCYKVGYDDGLGMSGSCPSGHSSEFCRGWDDATSSSSSSSSSPALEQNASNQQAPQQNVSSNLANITSPQPNATSEAPDQLVGGTQLQEYAVVFPPLVNMHFGVYHNEKGVFIPWKILCSHTQQYLAQSCDSLINPDGSLTSQGDRAVGCIWNGAMIAGAANMLHLPLATITGILGGLAQPTGCGGIVNMNQIQSSPMVQNFQQFLPTKVSP